jgi:Zn-dependent peptidase ImmA (M78 family)
MEIKNLEFQINPERLKYLLDLYKLTKEDFLIKIQGKNKNPVLSINELNKVLNNNQKVKVSILKKIDAIFEKGVSWYISRRNLPSREKYSIFFRKNKFNSPLNIGSIKKVEEFERKKNEIETLCNNISYNMKKQFNFCLNDNPEIVAKKILKEFDVKRLKLKKDVLLKKGNSDRDYLENLIRIIEEFNVFIFEFTENWNKKEKVDFNGFFITPNLIVIKRQQKYLKREIFTLLHEFAHYLLGEEEIDEKVGEVQNINDVEKWCNDFAFHFLIGEYSVKLSGLNKAEESNNFHQEVIEELSNKTRLSSLALYTRLKIINKISTQTYNQIKNNIIESIEKKQIEEKLARELENQILKEQGKKPFGMSPKPIESKLFREIVRINYFEGNISESKVFEALKINNKHIDEVIYS